MADDKLRVLIVGAHPDDADIKAGGTAAKWCALGHTVKLVSVSDGAAGHHQVYGPPLAARRKAEADAAARVIGATYEILGEPDGEVQATLDARRKLIRLIRSFRPDVLITHRTTDYHPDHCQTGLLVQDAAYLLTVPAICPETPHLTQSPVILYFSDAFRHPCRFEPHVIVDIGDTFERLVAMLHCHTSQFYEWLPYNAGYAVEVPQGDTERRTWLAKRMRRRLQPLAQRHRDAVTQIYGADRAAEIELIEAFQVSEFGAPLDAAARARLFPFVPQSVPTASAFVRKEWVDIPEAE